MSPRVVFLVSAAWSHVNPTLPLIRALVERGATVTYFAEAPFRAAVERVGATFCEVAPEPAAPRAPPLLDGPETLRRALARRHGLVAALRAVPALAAAVRAADPAAVVLDPTTGWHGLARSLGVPVATVTPSFFYTDGSPLIRSGHPTGADRESAALRAADDELQRVQASLRASHGIPPTDPDRLFTAPADLALAATYREFQPDGDAFRPPLFVYLGAALDERHEPELPELDAVRPPLLYVSMGSANVVGAELARTIVEAFADGSWTAVVAGHGGPPVLPDWALGRAVVPQLRVLERATVFVTHGGMNSVVEGVAHGVPMLVLPATPEQRLVARRVAELGLGVSLDRADLDPGALRATVERLAGDERTAGALARERPLARGADGAALAADVLLGLTGPPETSVSLARDSGTRQC